MLKNTPSILSGYFSWFKKGLYYNKIMDQNYDEKYWSRPCPKVKCKKASNCLHYFFIPAALGDDSGSAAPKKGDYSNAIVEYEANGAVYIYSSEGIPVNIKEGE